MQRKKLNEKGGIKMKSLYEKTLLGGIEVRNRFVRSATHESVSPDGSVTPEIIKLYKELAQAEVGLIVTSGMEVTEEKVFTNSMSICDDSCIEPLKEMTNTVHEAGGKILSQLLHGGSTVFLKLDYEPIGPSAVQDRFSKIIPKAMSKEDIEMIVNRFTDAAYRSQLAGFDGVQIQGSAGFTLNKFLSPYYNRRSDEYGGSIENRSRILVEIREAIAQKCGDDYPVFIKLSIDDLMKDGIKGLEYSEGKEIAKYLATSGYDAIEACCGIVGETLPTANYNGGDPYLKDQFIQLSKEIQAPLITVGGIRSERAAQELINSGNIQAVSFSRPFIADQDLVHRFKNGENTRCNTCHQCNGPKGIRCIQNA